MGPVGLSMANLLGKRGISVALIDKEKEPLPFPRAIHGDDETLRIFQAMGLEKEVMSIIASFSHMQMVDAGGKILTEIILDNGSRPYAFPTDYWFFQPELEKVLENGLTRFPNVQVLRGWEGVAYHEKEDAIQVEMLSSQSGNSRRIYTSWLVGCDGGRSWVRSLMKAEIRSLGFSQSWVVIDGKVPEEQLASLPDKHQQICDPNRPATYVPGVGNHRRWEFMLKKEEVHLPRPHLEKLSLSLLASHTSIEELEILRITSYVYHSLIAKKWRQGRIFMAGDAAHQMPPFLGQGMCSGIRDAENLSWKLAEVIQGRQSESLLATYQQERYAHTMELTRGAVTLGKLIQSQNRIIAGIRNWIFTNILSNSAILAVVQQKINHKIPFKKGFLGKKSHLSGQLFPQFDLHNLADGQTLKSDDLIGNGWTVLSMIAMDVSEKPAFLQLLCLSTAPLPWRTPAVETQPMKDWMQDSQVDFVIIRPDKYIYEAGIGRDWPPVFFFE